MLRAAAILMIVASHVKLFDLQGGAYVLLAVAGYNFARFQLTPGADRIVRLRSIGRSAWRVAAPSVVWITAVLLTIGSRDDQDHGEYPDIDMKFLPGRYSGRGGYSRKNGERY